MIGRLPSPNWTATDGQPATGTNPSSYALAYRSSAADERRLMDACADLITGGRSPWDAAAITYR